MISVQVLGQVKLLSCILNGLLAFEQKTPRQLPIRRYVLNLHNLFRILTQILVHSTHLGNCENLLFDVLFVVQRVDCHLILQHLIVGKVFGFIDLIAAPTVMALLYYRVEHLRNLLRQKRQ